MPIKCDALIVGGGPAGSTCGRALRAGGWDVLVIDRARFPRDKVCAGWITPDVFTLLDLDPIEYRASGLTLQSITGFRTSVIGSRPVETRYPSTVSYAIRRCEFDHFLLQRAGARVLEGTPVTTMRRERDRWIVNDAIEARVLIGAGGHFCPVARHLQGHPDGTQAIVAKELEVRLNGGRTSVAGDAPELFFSRDLDGYGWCVRKGDFLNVGIGRRDARDFGAHAQEFLAFLRTTGRAPESCNVTWHGHAYHAAGAGVRPLIGDAVIVIGDAAGLAYPESGEGIRPAIESGLLAARTLAGAGDRYDMEALGPYATAMRARHPHPTSTPGWVRPAVNVIGRALMRSRAFTSRVVLDSWFLRRT